jgi:hypothetical protein
MDLYTKIDSHVRLPLIDIALPAFRNLSQPQYAAFETNVRELIEADKRIEHFGMPSRAAFQDILELSAVATATLWIPV